MRLHYILSGKLQLFLMKCKQFSIGVFRTIRLPRKCILLVIKNLKVYYAQMLLKLLDIWLYTIKYAREHA
jgi:hypothetical protein